MIPPIPMLKIQDLPKTMPLDPHQGSDSGSRGSQSAAIEGLPPSPQAPPLDPVLNLIGIIVKQHPFWKLYITLHSLSNTL